jgi:hypothetical protein
MTQLIRSASNTARILAVLWPLGFLVLAMAQEHQPPPHPWTKSADLPDPVTNPKVFHDPPAETRPGVYWWWQDQPFGRGSAFDLSRALEELSAMRDAGIGKPHIEHWGRDYGNQQQRRNLREVAPFYRENRLQLEQTIGLGFPWTSPETTAAKKLTQQQLVYGRVDVAGGTHFSGPVPAASRGKGDLIAVTAARVVAARRSTILDPASLLDLNSHVANGTVEWDVPAGNWIVFGFWAQNAPSNPVFAGPGGKVSITSADSTRAGLGYVATNQVGEAAAAITGVISSFYEESQEDGVQGIYWNQTEHDKTLEEFARLRGYDIARYLPLLFVPGKYGIYTGHKEPAPDFDLPDGAGARYRHDYDETVTDLYIRNHLLPMQDWASKNYGARIDSQAAYGTIIDSVRAFRALTAAGGLADIEAWSGGDWDPYQTQAHPNWRFALDFYRQASSGAAQGGELEVSLEMGNTTKYQLLPTLGDLKYLMDKAWSAGLTRPEIHGMTLQHKDAPWPYVSRWAELEITESWNHRTYPEWQMLKPLADYWGRGALVLQQGAARTDVAFLRDDRTWIVPPTNSKAMRVAAPVNDTRRLEEKGFTIGYVDPVGVRETKTGESGALFPDGPAYRAIVIDGAMQNYIDPLAIAGATATALDRASAKGLAVVFVGAPPVRGNSGRNPAAEDAEVVRAVANMRARRTTRVVPELEDVAGALREIGVRPASEWPEGLSPQMRNLASGGVYSQLRERGSTRYFYLWNSSEQRVRFDGSFAAGGSVFSLNLWSGEIRPVGLYRTDGQRTIVPLELAPGETAVLAFASDGPGAPHADRTSADRVVVSGGQLEVQDARGGAHEITIAGASRTIVLAGVTDHPIPIGVPTAAFPGMSAPRRGAGWTIQLESWGPEGRRLLPAVALDQGLRPWHSIPALKDRSGIATYTAAFTLPASWTAPVRGVRMNLGDIAGGSVQAYINGKLANANVSPKDGVETDITALLKPGVNEIKVIFASTLFNRARVEPAILDPKAGFGQTLERFPGPQQSGLIGPVVLTPYARAKVIP